MRAVWQRGAGVECVALAGTSQEPWARAAVGRVRGHRLHATLPVFTNATNGMLKATHVRCNMELVFSEREA